MKGRRKPGFFIGALVLLAAALLIRGLVGANKDGVVIQLGIQAFRGITTAFNVIIIVLAVIALVSAGLYLKNWLDAKKEQAKAEAEEEEQRRKAEPDAVLSVSKDLDARKLYEILTTYASRSHTASEELLRCAMQLKTMDIYQEKLENLLDDNGAESLFDTKDVLDKVEQYLCKEVRKVINYINVADENSEEDAKMILQKLDECYHTCQTQLDQVKDFLFAMAEFLNKQGDNDTTPETLEIYKQCILKSIQEEEK